MRNLIPPLIHEQFERGRRAGTFEAATLFVDISGFTPLTETLAQHRKDGAEVLSEALEAIFGPLVRQVYARGGLIPLFAGDAFTALFPHDPATTPDAPLHALQTAFFIQDLFTPKGRDRVFSTKYGDFAIGVKVGLSYGPVRWGIPGHEGRFSFYFRGPAVDGCALAEQQTAKGQIGADDMILPAIKEHVTAEALAGTSCYRLTACSLDLPASGTVLPPFSRADLAPFLQDAVLDFTAKAEFREVCPLFLSFEESVGEATLHQFLTAALILANTYGGTFSQIDFGDKGGIVVLWFGAPVSYENNVERAAEFLLALRRRDWPLRWRAGLTFGTVWAGLRGGVERCEYGLIGDVVNLAARLAMKAGWGELWVDPAAYERLKDAYRLEARGVFLPKGKRDEIHVYHLQARRERAEAAVHTGEMVGRQGELDQLAACVQPIFAGRFAGLIYLYGEAGIGKSRLVYELGQRLIDRGARCFVCPADQILRQSLNPFKRFLRRYFDQFRDRSAEQNRVRFDAVLDALLARLQAPGVCDELAATELARELERTRSFLGALVDVRWEDSLYERLEPKLRFENTLAAFRALMLAESLCQPVLLHLEDLQWLDADSEELVKLLVRSAEAGPLAVVCTSRYRDDGSRVTLAVGRSVPQQVMELDTLSPAGVRALAEQILGPSEAEGQTGEIADGLALFLLEKTGGNPFFVEQLVLDLRERGAVVSGAGGQWTVVSKEIAEVPTTIGAVVIARLDRLAAEVKEVVQTAAVLGREFEVQVLSRMLRGEAEVPARVEQAEVERIWTALSEMRYIFRHALLRDAAYDMQLRARLRELHTLAAEAIGQVYAADLAPHYADLVYHHRRAGDVEQERTYAKLAGERAAAQFANVEAVRYFSRALELAPEDDLAGRYALLLAREKVFELQGVRNAQLQDLAGLRSLAESLDDCRARAEVALRQANYAQVTGDYPAATTAAQQALSLAEDEATRAKGHRAWARALCRLGEYRAAQAHLEDALGLIRATGPHQASSRASLAVEADSLRVLGLLCLYQDDNAGAQEYWEQTLRIYRQLDDRQGEGTTLNNLGAVFMERGDYGKANRYYERALRIRREIGDRRHVGGSVANLGIVASWQGDYTGAKGYFEQGLVIARESDDRRGECVALSNLGRLFHHLGDDEAAREYSQQALDIAREIRDRFLAGYALAHLGHTLAGLGQFAEATDAYMDAFTSRRELGQLSPAMECLAGLARVSLMRGDLSQAQDHVEQILDYLESNTLIGAEEPIRVYLTCYQVLRAAQDPRSLDVLNTAHSLLQEWAAKIEDEDVRRSFLENVVAHREIVAAHRAMQAAG